LEQSLALQGLVGCAIRKTYFDSMKGIVRSDFIRPENLIVNYYTRYIEDAPRVTHVRQMTDSDIKQMQADGIFLKGVEFDSINNTPDVGDNKQAEDERTGQTQPENDKNVSVRTILEQHCWDNFEDTDKPSLPYIKIVDKETKQVLRIESRLNPHKTGNTYQKTINYFTKYDLFPSPTGSFYPMGFGALLDNINET
ncbi:unnamed protein product, partial [marine sediment metagenome]